MRNDAHDFPKRLEKKISSIRKSQTILPDNRNLIVDFYQACLADGLTAGRILKHVYNLVSISSWLGKSFIEAKKDDIAKLVVKIDVATYRHTRTGIEKPYSEISKRDFRVTLKKFFKWLRGTGEAPEEVKWIRTHERANQHKLPEDMLTEEEVERLINNAKNPRDKALIAALYESGCRIGELIFLKIGQVIFDEYGAYFTVQGKTGYRRVRIIAAVPHLTDWLNNHPCKNDPETWVWISRNKERMEYTSVNKMLRQVAKRAEVKKHVNPHNFRHSRATYLANHLTEAQMKEFFGWVQSSDVASVYVHLSGRDVDKALLKTYGIETPKDKSTPKLNVKVCRRCKSSNPSTNRFCFNCSMILDENEAMSVIRRETENKYHEQVDKILDFLLHDPKFLKMFSKKFKEYGDSLPAQKPSEA